MTRKRTTKGRKIFLSAVNELGGIIPGYGEEGELFGKIAKAMHTCESRNKYRRPFGSAVFVMSAVSCIHHGLDPNECHEECVAANLLMAIYQAGRLSMIDDI
jgi:hypothetical protein